MKIRLIKKKVAITALAVALALGAGSALAVRANGELDPQDCRQTGGAWTCDGDVPYTHCELELVSCVIFDWFCTYRWVCTN